MQTRITYREHAAVQAAIQELAIRYADRDPLLAFTELCLGGLNGETLGGLSPLLVQLKSQFALAISRAAAASKPQKPVWAARIEAVLHLSERILGAPARHSVQRALEPRTAAYRQ